MNCCKKVREDSQRRMRHCGGNEWKKMKSANLKKGCDERGEVRFQKVGTPRKTEEAMDLPALDSQTETMRNPNPKPFCFFLAFSSYIHFQLDLLLLLLRVPEEKTVALRL